MLVKIRISPNEIVILQDIALEVDSVCSDSSHLCSSVHQNYTLEVRDLESFHQLAIQGLIVAVHHLHCVIDIITPLVVVEGVKPKNRVFLIFN